MEKKKAMKAAKVYLENRGYEIVDENYKCPFGKIDFVSNLDGKLVFTNVKTYENKAMKLPKEKISDNNRQKIEQLMACYLAEHECEDMSIRFDNMRMLILKGDKAFIRYHVNALGPDSY